MLDEIMNIRRRNLQALIVQHGSASVLSRKLGYSQASYLYQILMGHRGLGENFARSVEHKLTLPSGWMDIAHEHETPLPPMPTAHPPEQVELLTASLNAVMNAAEKAGVPLEPFKFKGAALIVYEAAKPTGKINPVIVSRLLELLK